MRRSLIHLLCVSFALVAQADIAPHAGLWQVVFKGTSSATAERDWSRDIMSVPEGTDWQTRRRRELGPILAYKFGDPSSRSMVTSAIHGDQPYWFDYTQIAYCGYIYLESDKTYKFRANIDDDGYIKISDAQTGVATVLIDFTDNRLHTSGSYSVSQTGWHAIEIRMGNGMGGAGGNPGDSSESCGISADNGVTWKKIMDPGDGSFLRVYNDYPFTVGEVRYENTRLSCVLTDEGIRPEPLAVYAFADTSDRGKTSETWTSDFALGTWQVGCTDFVAHVSLLPTSAKVIRFAAVPNGDWFRASWSEALDASSWTVVTDPDPKIHDCTVASVDYSTASFTLNVLSQGTGSETGYILKQFGYDGQEYRAVEIVKTAADVAGCTTIKQDGLRPGSVYRFRLAVSNDLGRVVWTDPLEVSTTAEDLGFMHGSAGLWQVRFTNANADWTKDIFSVSVGTDWKTQRRRELGPIQAYATRSQKYTSEVWGDQVYWINEDYNQWAYAGLIYLDATKTYKFRTKIDDDELLKITDAGTGAETTLINDTRDGSSVITSAAYSPSVTGWHTIEIRFSDGSGGAGGYDSSSSYKNTYNLGYSDDNGSTWKFLLDPGDGSFLCVGKADDIVAGEMLFDGTSLSTVLTRNVANAAYAPEAKVYAVYGADYHANDLSAWESENKKLLGTWREGLATFSPYLGDLPSNIRYVRFVIVAGSGATAGTFWMPTILVNELEKNVGVQPQFGNVEFASNTCVTATFDVQVLTRGADASAVTLAATYSYEGEHGFEETTELLSGSDVVGTRTVTLKNLKPNARYSATFTLKNNRSENVTSDPVLFNTQAESFGNIAAFPGLWQARFVEANRDWSKNLFDVAEGTDWQTKRRRELGAIQAYATRTQRYTSEVWKDEIYWVDQNENQWVYGGYIYLEKDKAYKFRSKIDDNEKIAVTDFGTGVTTVLIDDQADSSDVLTSASFTPTVTGWHRIEIRFSDGYGGAGGYDTSSNYKNTNNLGFSSDGGSTWQFLIDPGDGTLLLPERPDSVRVQETVFDGVTLNAVIGRREVPFAETSTMKVYAVFDVAYHGDVLADWPDAQKVYLGTWNGAEGTFIAGVSGLGNMRYLRFVLTSADGARQHWSDTLFLPETPRNATEVPVLFGATVTATSTASAAFHVDVLAQGTNTVSATLKFVYAYEDEKGPHCITNEVARREKLTGTYDYEIVAIPAGTDYTAYFYVETDCGAIARFPADEPLSFTTLPANTLLAASAATSSFRYDVRSTYPGKLVRGMVTIGDADGGEPMAWDTSTLSDGWNKVTKGGHADDLVVLNNPNVSIEGGRLELNAEWTADKTHLIRNTVYIPSGRTLTVTQGAVVKFCAGTGIKIEDGGTLNIVGAEGADVIFTAANDDTVGEKIVGLPKGVITHKGVWKQTSSATLADNNYVQMRGTSFGDYSTVYLNDSTAFRSSESALIPVTLGGANRSKPFSIDWVAKDASAKFGEDYTLASGRITWNQYNEGTKTITIPLVKEHVVGSNTTFTIEIVTNRAVNVGRQVCTVTIREWDTLNLQSAAMESSFVRFDMRKSTPGRTMHGVEKITSGGNDDETAVENWNTATVEDGWTTLTRSTNSLEVLAVNAESIAIEGGRIAANTTWTSDKTHLLRNTVYIPSGKTLTVTTNAVVKFMVGTGIKIEDGGKLNVIGSSDGDVIFTAANDDTIGAVIPGMPEGAIPHNGFWKQSSSANFTDNGWIETRNWGTGLYPEMWLNDTTAFRSIGMAYIPVTIGGSRDQTLSVDWRTVDGTAKYGEDFTQNAGRVTWNKASEGTKIIQIPLVKNHIVGGTTSFEIEIVVNRGVNVSRRTCTVEIRELDTLDFSFGSADSASVRYDERQTFPGLLNTGVVTLGSPDGKTTTAWNTKDEENGWVTVTSGETNADLAVINDAAISIEGGRLTSNTTWSSNVTHLVRNTVYVPNGITLTLSEGTVVKYLEGTTIKIEDGGKLNVVGSVGNDVVLTAANDDTVGAEIPAVDKTETIPFTGITKMSSGTYTDNMYVQTRGFSYGNYPTLTIHDAVVNRVNGKVYLPVTVSGTTRNQSFNVDWEVVPDSAVFGTDYLVKSGTLSWAKSGDGTKQIEIPLNASSLLDERRSFKVKFVAARGTNVADGEAIVTIHEYTDCGINADVLLAESPVSADFAVQESIKRQPIFRGETEEIRYDGKWQTRRDAKDTVVRISVESDNGITRLAEYPGDQVGAYLWRASDYNVGYYTLKHEIVYAETREILDTVTKSFSIVDEDDVVLHGGTLTQNETWKAGKTHVVYETVVVPSIYTLFIEPGAIVKFMSGTGIDISQGGALFANAIIFTHIDDDTIGGDTLSDGYTVAPSMDSYALNGNFTFGADTEIRYITQASALTGTISDQRVLSRGSTYRVSGTVTVVNGGSLTIPSGTVLKMEVGASIVVNAGGRINSNGTRAAPVIITSMNDDSYSGKMEGSNSNPQPGDWTKITINGAGFFDFTKILYSSRNSTTGAINMNGGTTTFINSEIAHCAYDAVGVESGHFYMTNSIIADALLAFRHWARDPIVNCVIYDCGRLTQGGGQHFVNCVFSRISETWEAFGFPQNGTTYNNCVFWNEDGSVLTGEGRQDAMTVCGKNGNIWGNPLFIDPDNYDFRISEMSPCVDAADSLAAPARDLYGQPRLTVKASSDVALGVPAADIGVCEVMLRSVTSDIDLEARSVRGETNAVPGKLLFVKWEVANVGGSPVDVEWRDTISLVSEDGLQEVTLGDKKTSSTIAIGGTAFCSAYFTVPAMAEGKWYPKVNVNSYHDIFEGTLTANNVLIGSTAIDIETDKIDASEGDEGVVSAGSPKVLKMSFAAEDENRMVRIAVPAGVIVRWGFGFMPSANRNSGSATGTGTDILFKVPEGETDVYVSLDADATAEYALTTESGKVAITSVSPTTLPSSGEVSITIDGAGFTADNEVVLSDGQNRHCSKVSGNEVLI